MREKDRYCYNLSIGTIALAVYLIILDTLYYQSTMENIFLSKYFIID